MRWLLCSASLRVMLVSSICSLSPFALVGRAEDQPQWGRPHSRNMVSDETGLPSDFDPETGHHIKWSAPLGTHGYGSPTIASGKVLIGANNAEPRDPRHVGDRSVLLCLDEQDGSMDWQLVVPRIEGGDIFKDWPNISMSSPPTIEGDRVYTMTNRFEVVCLDLHGQSNGNDGPYLDEGKHMVSLDSDTGPMDVTSIDADIIWMFDLLAEVGSYPHDGSHCSVLIDGENLYVNTCNGVDNTHKVIRSPEAPSLVVLDKSTGRLVAQDVERIGPQIFHSTWSSPAMGEINGQRLAFFAGGDGILYGFKALDPRGGPSAPVALERPWRFDCDPEAPKQDIHSFLRNRKVSPSNVKSMPVLDGERLYVTYGGDIWWGKNEAWLVCVDATGQGEVTHSARLWTYPLEKHVCSTPSVYKGMVFVADCGGKLHCINAETGEAYWTEDIGREVWGSTLVADGKVYVGTRAGDFWIFAADKVKQPIAHIQFDSPIHTSPVAANGVLYVATLKRLYAIEQK
ncbi:outer membrane protein assembly factor BamB family protein [Novipirellula artificiosorum]|uniref:Outer membrane biogenesis protein BamB n=1 Tax=Novipirellula artificiosorum TaxID=2528016 RepID=A0A5C6DCD9_9BACT|nr:PQQ-binding-like beta-propeller repeat protein [Novipirellula artificiosorum]TWU34338.1 outer membrane biogenesis protein BamB [Novipirellula artificiosorum]